MICDQLGEYCRILCDIARCSFLTKRNSDIARMCIFLQSNNPIYVFVRCRAGQSSILGWKWQDLMQHLSTGELTSVRRLWLTVDLQWILLLFVIRFYNLRQSKNLCIWRIALRTIRGYKSLCRGRGKGCGNGSFKVSVKGHGSTAVVVIAKIWVSVQLPLARSHAQSRTTEEIFLEGEHSHQFRMMLKGATEDRLIKLGLGKKVSHWTHVQEEKYLRS